MGQDLLVVVPATDDEGNFRQSVPEGGRTCLQFHGNSVHLFDPETGANLEFAPRKSAQPAAEPPAAPVQPEEAPAGTEPEA